MEAIREAVLIFDVGTTNFKTLLFGAAGGALFTRSAPLAPVYGGGGMVTQNPGAWRSAAVAGGAAAAAFAREKGIAVIAVSATASRSSVIPVDAQGNHLGDAMMWQETASREIVAGLNSGENLRKIFSRTASRPNTVYSAPKMTWLKRERPELYRRADKLAGILDCLIAFLAGRLATDHTCASRTLLMNVFTREWDPALLNLFGVEAEKLCPLLPPGSIVGGLTKEAAEATGLPPGLPVVNAGGDQNNAALGAGIVRRGDVMINMGTGSFLVAAVDGALADPAMRVMCNASAVPGKYVLDAGMLATGSVHRWFVEKFYNGDYDAADAEAEAAAPGCGGLLCLPHFSGRGAPEWESRASGVFYGLGLEHGRGDMGRAVYEGIAAEIAGNLSVIDGLVGGVSSVVLAGGLSKCAFFDQLLADVCGRGVRLAGTREATARGAWAQAMRALGREAVSAPECAARAFAPDASRADVYARLCARREKLFAALAAVREE